MSQINEMLRFDIPDAGEDFRQYVFELRSRIELIKDIHDFVLNAGVDIANGLTKDHDKRLISEYEKWESLGYTLTEMNFIFYKSILDVSFMHLQIF